ncbi:MAG: hypothetical protein ACK5MR_09375 [Cumulibacter sp.]
MLTPYDDFPLHQTALPLAQVGDGHPDFYDRFWFNGYNEEMFFAVAMGLYPNRGVIDAAFSTVLDGEQRSVYASGRAPLDRSHTEVGPIRVQILEPLRRNRIIVDAPEQGLKADLTFTARTAACEEPRHTRYNGVRLAMDVTRATSLGSWQGTIEVNGREIAVCADTVRGVKDRSWGIRAVGEPAPRAPEPSTHQLFFLWAPLNFDDVCLHYMLHEDAHGKPWAKTAAVLPVIGADDPVTGPGTEAIHIGDMQHEIDWAPGLRRSQRATLRFSHPETGAPQTVDLEPLFTFRMRGAGYGHPRFKHGAWHDELVVGGEVHAVEQLDNLDVPNLHVQQIVRATWGDKVGIGAFEQFMLGPHAPSGATGLNEPPVP